MTDCPVIDAHVHFWDPRRLQYDWHREFPSLNRPFVLNDFDSAAQGIDVAGFVFVECDCKTEQSLDEVTMVTEMAASEPRIRAIVAQAELEHGVAVRSHLEALQQFPLVKGVRRITQGEVDPDFCNRPGFIEGVRCLPEYGFTCDLCITHDQLAATTRMIRSCQDVSFVLDHLGKPNIRQSQREPWASELRALTELPNVWCKFSGVVTEANHAAWQRQDLEFYLKHAINCFGPERLMYGGDWPVVTLASSYSRWFDVAQHVLSELSATELAKVFCKNAKSFYRLD